MSTLPTLPWRVSLVVLAATLAPVVSAHDGLQYFEERCAKCHSEEKVVAALKPLASPNAVRQRLEELLPKHHAPEHDVHEPLIVYLLSLLPRPTTP